MGEREPLLEVRHLKKYFGAGGKKELKAVDDVSFIKYNVSVSGIRVIQPAECTVLLTKHILWRLFLQTDIHTVTAPVRKGASFRRQDQIRRGAFNSNQPLLVPKLHIRRGTGSAGCQLFCEKRRDAGHCRRIRMREIRDSQIHHGIDSDTSRRDQSRK